MRNKSNLLKSLVILIFMNAILTHSCMSTRTRKATSIRIKGSDTMWLLTERWSEEYMKSHPSISIYAEGGGTVLGVQALIKGEAEICAASRPLRASEVRQLAEAHDKIGLRFLVAKDALSIFINYQNPIQTISLQQLKDIFTGRITNWKQIGGLDQGIQVITRSPNSGTYFYVKEHVLEGEEYTQAAKTVTSTKNVVDAVFENEAAIGYGGIAYGEDVKHCKIGNVAPTAENVRNDSYPVIRYLYFYTIDSPRGATKAFIDWVIKEGQAIVKSVGYIPIWQHP